jgi:hypothetical protein
VAVWCCTARRLNTHGTTERRLLYPWRPWSGLSVHVHEVIERGRGTVLRCSLSGDAGRCLEVPAWMFEAETCVPLRLGARPQAGVDALFALRRLLAEASSRSPMDAVALASEGDSPDQNWGEVHAMLPRPPPGEVGNSSSASRSVRPAPGGKRPGRSGLAGAAREDAAGLTGLLARLLLAHGATTAHRAGGRHERQPSGPALCIRRGFPSD